MAHFTYEEFKEQVAENIRDYLPDDYKEAEVKISTVNKIGKTYESLSVRPKNKSISPAANLDMFFDAYQNGRLFGDILSDVAEVILMEIPLHAKNMSWIFDYEQAQKKLFIRVCNADSNKKLEDAVPYQKVEDLIITCHIAVDQTPAGMTSTIVNNELLTYYGISKEQLFEDAMDHAPEVMPVKIDSIENFMSLLIFGSSEETSSDNDSKMLIVTNEAKINGAAAIFYSGVLDQVYDKIGGSFLIIPSSVNEVIIIPDYGSYNELKDMVKDVNSSSVAPEERLSDNIYKYDITSKSLKIVA